MPRKISGMKNRKISIDKEEELSHGDSSSEVYE